MLSFLCFLLEAVVAVVGSDLAKLSIFNCRKQKWSSRWIPKEWKRGESRFDSKGVFFLTREMVQNCVTPPCCKLYFLKLYFLVVESSLCTQNSTIFLKPPPHTTIQPPRPTTTTTNFLIHIVIVLNMYRHANSFIHSFIMSCSTNSWTSKSTPIVHFLREEKSVNNGPTTTIKTTCWPNYKATRDREKGEKRVDTQRIQVKPYVYLCSTPCHY